VTPPCATRLSCTLRTWICFVVACLLAPRLALGAGSTCPAGIGTQNGDPPARVLRLGKSPGLLVCGWSDTEATGTQVYSEFELINALVREPVLRFGATDAVTIQAQASRITLIEHHAYPIGPRWSYVSVPYRRHVVTWDVKAGFRTRSTLVFTVPRWSAAQRAEILARYGDAVTGGRAPEGLAILVVLAALAGDPRFEALLPTVPKDLHLDGALAEEFAAAMRDYQEITRSRRGTLTTP
jgi:hypothetical protein